MYEDPLVEVKKAGGGGTFYGELTLTCVFHQAWLKRCNQLYKKTHITAVLMCGVWLAIIISWNVMTITLTLIGDTSPIIHSLWLWQYFHTLSQGNSILSW